jgi:hypothetical protein
MTTQQEKAYRDQMKAWCRDFARRAVRHGYVADTNTAVFTRSLAQVLAQPFDRRLTELETEALLPSVPAVDMGAATVISQGHQIAGIATMTTTFDTEINTVDIQGQEVAMLMYSAAAKWFMGYQQIRQAAMANVPLESKKRNACMRVINEAVDRCLAFGEDGVGLTGAGLTGVWNNALVPLVQGAVTPGYTGIWAGAATDAQIIADVGLMWDAIKTGNYFKPTHLYVGPLEYTRLVDPTLHATYGGPPLKDLIESSFNVEVVEVERLRLIPLAYTAGGVAVARACMCEMTSDVFYPHISAQEEFPPVQADAGYSITMHKRVGGVECPQPLGAIYLDMA